MFDTQPVFPLPWQWSCPNNAKEVQLGQDQAFECQDLRRNLDFELGDDRDPEWLNIFEDISRLSHKIFNLSPMFPTSTMDKVSAERGLWTISIIHRLLSYRPLQNALSIKATHIQEACRLGALLYMVPVWRFFGVAPVASSTLLTNLHKQFRDSDGAWGHLWTLKLWILYLAAAESLDGNEVLESWFVNQLARLCLSNGISDWRVAMALIKTILWFDCLFWKVQDRLDEKMKLRLDQERGLPKED